MGCQKCMAVTVSRFKHTSVSRVSHFTLHCVMRPSYDLILKLFKNVIKANIVPCLSFL